MSDLSDNLGALSHQDMMDLNEILEKDKSQTVELEPELSISDDSEIDLDSDSDRDNNNLIYTITSQDVKHDTTNRTDQFMHLLNMSRLVEKLVPTMSLVAGHCDGALFVELSSSSNDEIPLMTTDKGLDTQHSNIIIEECPDESSTDEHSVVESAQPLGSPQPLESPEVSQVTQEKTPVKIKPETNIIINVGGKLIRISKSILAKLNVNYGRLKKYTFQDKTVYFLDRDPIYFNKIVEAMKLFGSDADSLSLHINKFSNNLINELCIYNLIDTKFCPKPKLKLKRIVGFPERHNTIVTITVGDHRYETFSHTLTRSTELENKMKTMMPVRSNNLVLDADPDVFRYVLNFMRTGVLHTDTEEIRAMLINYGIEFIRLENRSTNDTIVTNHIPYTHYPMEDTISAQQDIILYETDSNPNLEYTYDFCAPKNNQYVTDFCSFNTITPVPDTKLIFDSPIRFDLTSGIGDAITDIMVCVDLPVLNPIEKAEYIDMLEFKLIEYAVVAHDTNNKLMFHTNNEFSYLFPMIYKRNYSEYHKISRSSVQQKTKVLYNEILIDVHRVIVPLYILDSVQNHLPVKRLLKNSHNMFLELKVAPLKKILKGKIIDIPLLNVSLNVNYLNFPVEHPQQLYLYTRWISLKMVISQLKETNNVHYDLCTVPLSSSVPRLIKDFFFVIVDKSDNNSNVLDKFNDKFVELEIIRKDANGRSATLCKLDSMCLSTIIPLQKLGHSLPPGMYYYSFSIDPKSDAMLGGLPTYKNSGIEFQFKVKKSDSIIKLFIREYVYEFY